MNIQYIISNALIDYDKNKEKINKILNLVSDINIIYTKEDNERNIIQFTDTNDNIILDSEFEILGIYYPEDSVWIWGWAIPEIIYPNNFLSHEIFNHAMKSGREYLYIKSLLVNSRMIITDDVQIDINLALCTSIIKHYNVYKLVRTSSNNILSYMYIILLNEKDINSFTRDKLKENKNNLFIL